MTNYLIRRILVMAPTLLVISILVFVVVELPPGDLVTSQLQLMEQQGLDISHEQVQVLRARFNLDDPPVVRYLRWITGFVRGDMGYSVLYGQRVNALVWERLAFTMVITLAATLFTWIIAFSVGIFSALRQYSIWDYLATVLAFLGLATPNFMLALVLMYLGYEWFGISIGGLFSPEYEGMPWSFGKLLDFLAHLWVPAIVVGTGGAAGLMRIMRANLLDEFSKPYVLAARLKGVHPVKLVIKYPLRIAANPFISTVGWMLPRLISGAAITAVVLGLPTTGPLLLEALLSQDMYLAGSFLLMLSVLTVIGTLISDVLLAIVDPRIRYE